MDAMYATWVNRWQATLDACRRKGGEVSELIIMPPATPEAVAEVEAKIGQVLPLSFRKVLLEFSAHVELSWNLAAYDIKLPKETPGVMWGGSVWDLSKLIWREEYRADCADEHLGGNDLFDEHWLNKLAFAYDNGDMFAFDLNVEQDPPVICLSHEFYEPNGFRLGSNFVDFVGRWTALGCPAVQVYSLQSFLDNPTSGLNVTGENARKWREWFGLDFEVT